MGQEMSATRVASPVTIQRRLDALWKDTACIDSTIVSQLSRAENMMLIYITAMQLRATNAKKPDDVLPAMSDSSADQNTESMWNVKLVACCSKSTLTTRLMPVVQRVAAVYGGTFASRAMDICLDLVLQPNGPLVLHLANVRRQFPLRRQRAIGSPEPVIEALRRVTVVAGCGHRLAATVWPGFSMPDNHVGARPSAADSTTWKCCVRPRVVLTRGATLPPPSGYDITKCPVNEQEVNDMMVSPTESAAADGSPSNRNVKVSRNIINCFIAKYVSASNPVPLDTMQTYVMPVDFLNCTLPAQTSVAELQYVAREWFKSDFELVDCVNLRFVVMPLFTNGTIETAPHGVPATKREWRVVVVDVSTTKLVVLGNVSRITPIDLAFVKTVLAVMMPHVVRSTPLSGDRANINTWTIQEFIGMWPDSTTDDNAIGMLLSVMSVADRHNLRSDDGKNSEFLQKRSLELARKIIQGVITMHGSVSKSTDSATTTVDVFGQVKMSENLSTELQQVAEHVTTPSVAVTLYTKECTETLSKYFAAGDAGSSDGVSFNCVHVNSGAAECNCSADTTDRRECNCWCACHTSNTSGPGGWPYKQNEEASFQPPQPNADAGADADAPAPVESPQWDKDDTDASAHSAGGGSASETKEMSDSPLGNALWSSAMRRQLSESGGPWARIVSSNTSFNNEILRCGHIGDSRAGTMASWKGVSLAYQVPTVTGQALSAFQHQVKTQVTDELKKVSKILALNVEGEGGATFFKDNGVGISALLKQQLVDAGKFPEIETVVHVTCPPVSTLASSYVSEATTARQFRVLNFYNQGLMYDKVGTNILMLGMPDSTIYIKAVPKDYTESNQGYMRRHLNFFNANVETSGGVTRNKFVFGPNTSKFSYLDETPNPEHMLTTSVSCDTSTAPSVVKVHRQLTIIIDATTARDLEANMAVLSRTYPDTAICKTPLELFRLLTCPSQASGGNSRLQPRTLAQLKQLLNPDLPYPDGPPDSCSVKNINGVAKVGPNSHAFGLPRAGFVVGCSASASAPPEYQYHIANLVTTKQLQPENIPKHFWDKVESTFTQDIQDAVSNLHAAYSIDKITEYLASKDRAHFQQTDKVTRSDATTATELFGVGYEYLSTYRRQLHISVQRLCDPATSRLAEVNYEGDGGKGHLYAMNYLGWAFPDEEATAARIPTKSKKIILAGVLAHSAGIRPDARVPDYPNRHCGQIGWGRLHGILLHAPQGPGSMSALNPDSTFTSAGSSPASFVVATSDPKTAEYIVTAAVDPAERVVHIQCTLAMRHAAEPTARMAVSEQTEGVALLSQLVHSDRGGNLFKPFEELLQALLVPLHIRFRIADNIYETDCEAVWRRMDSKLVGGTADDMKNLKDRFGELIDSELKEALLAVKDPTSSMLAVTPQFSPHDGKPLVKLLTARLWDKDKPATQASSYAAAFGTVTRPPGNSFRTLDIPVPSDAGMRQTMFESVAKPLAELWLTQGAVQMNAIVFTSSDKKAQNDWNTWRVQFMKVYAEKINSIRAGRAAAPSTVVNADNTLPSRLRCISGPNAKPAPVGATPDNLRSQLVLAAPIGRKTSATAHFTTYSVVEPPNIQPERGAIEEKADVIVCRGDITKLSGINVIVNAANEKLEAGTGVCGAIFTAADKVALANACTEAKKSFNRGNIGEVPVGSTSFTPASGRLQSEKGFQAIFHSVGPRNKDPVLLRNAYKTALDMCLARGYKSIAFPSISTGVFGMDIASACATALEAVHDWFSCVPQAERIGMTVYLVTYSQDDFDVYKAQLETYAATYTKVDAATVKPISPVIRGTPDRDKLTERREQHKDKEVELPVARAAPVTIGEDDVGHYDSIGRRRAMEVCVVCMLPAVHCMFAQDTHNIILDVRLKTLPEDMRDDKWVVLGVYDGHAGNKASAFAQLQFAYHLTHAKGDSPADVLTNAIRNLDEAFFKEYVSCLNFQLASLTVSDAGPQWINRGRA